MSGKIIYLKTLLVKSKLSKLKIVKKKIEENSYEVDKILDHKTVKKVEYMAKHQCCAAKLRD